MSNNISLKSHVNSTLLDKVEQECYQILLQQRLHYNGRWFSSPLVKRTSFIIRLAGLAASLFGVILGVFYLVYPSACPTWIIAGPFLIFTICATIFFYYLPRIETRLFSRFKKAGGKGCKRMARRFVSKARKIIPYEVEYLIKGDLITSFRGKDGAWKQVWSTRLKGFAVMGANVTLLFRNPKSIVQKILIIHENSDALEAVLRDLEIPYKRGGK